MNPSESLIERVEHESTFQRALVRKRLATEKREAMRAGVVRKAQTFRAAKGKGSYRRKTKHQDRSH